METIKEMINHFSIDDVTDIQIKTELSQVNVINGSENDIVLRWTDTNRRKSTAELNNKKLVVKNHANAALYGIVGLIWLKKDKELTLELPTGFSGSVQIESRDECIRILGVNCSAILRAKTIIAPIEVSATDVQSFELESQSGNISMRGVTSQKGISVVTNTGKIECNCAENSSEYLLDCRSEHGKCNMPVILKRGKKHMRLHSKTGSITVNFADYF